MGNAVVMGSCALQGEDKLKEWRTTTNILTLFPFESTQAPYTGIITIPTRKEMDIIRPYCSLVPPISVT